MKNENWKPISIMELAPDYDISDLGRIRSWVYPIKGGRKRRHSPKILATPIGKSGYRQISLWINGSRQTFLVSRLVLLAFVGESTINDAEACHVNGDTDDNRLANLRWDTPAGNSSDRKRHGTEMMGESHPMARLTWAIVREIRRTAKESGEGSVKISRRFGISKSAAGRILSGKAWVENRIGAEKCDA